MKKLLITLLLAVGLCWVGAAFAATDDGEVTLEVPAITTITITGAPTLTVVAGDAGTDPAEVDDATSTISFSCNQLAYEINAVSDIAFPAGSSFSIAIGTLSGDWTTEGKTAIDAVTAVNLATGGRGAYDAITLTYYFDAAISTPSMSQTLYTITYTLEAA
jgi:hypothetical protein